MPAYCRTQFGNITKTKHLALCKIPVDTTGKIR